jgi:hypothetical protein
MIADWERANESEFENGLRRRCGRRDFGSRRDDEPAVHFDATPGGQIRG